MDSSQSTFEEILASEHAMMLAAIERYGAFYTHARACSVFPARRFHSATSCMPQMIHRPDRLGAMPHPGAPDGAFIVIFRLCN
jgi:hypothetical protein